MTKAAIPKPEQQPTMTVEEAARFLGVGRSAAYEAVRRGEIPAIRIGRFWRVPTAALRQMVRLYG